MTPEERAEEVYITLRMDHLVAMTRGFREGPTSVITAAIRASVDAERRRLIPLVCLEYCGDAETIPERHDVELWLHNMWPGFAFCPASPIYEAIRADSEETP